MATFTHTPSLSTSLKQKPKILEAKFGDGYEQAVFNGINYTPEMWKLTFDNISTIDAQIIVDFFNTYNTATTPFDWTNPNGVLGKYKCREWSRTYDGFEHNNLSCTFEEVFWG